MSSPPTKLRSKHHQGVEAGAARSAYEYNTTLDVQRLLAQFEIIGGPAGNRRQPGASRE
ncbi:MAG: hypothetical protein ACQSGP_14455 [Frankia sp.]